MGNICPHRRSRTGPRGRNNSHSASKIENEENEIEIHLHRYPILDGDDVWSERGRPMGEAARVGG